MSMARIPTSLAFVAIVSPLSINETLDLSPRPRYLVNFFSPFLRGNFYFFKKRNEISEPENISDAKGPEEFALPLLMN